LGEIRCQAAERGETVRGTHRYFGLGLRVSEMKADQAQISGSEPKNPKTSPIVHAVLISVQFCFSGWHIIGSVALVSQLKDSLRSFL
jgi:hypothetical protein